MTAHVIKMVMGGQDGDQAGRAAMGLVEDGTRFGAIDDGGIPGGWIDQEVGVVVGELRDRDDFHEF